MFPKSLNMRLPSWYVLHFAQVVVIGVLMLNLLTSYANRSLHNDRGNVICAKISFTKK